MSDFKTQKKFAKKQEQVQEELAHKSEQHEKVEQESTQQSDVVEQKEDQIVQKSEPAISTKSKQMLSVGDIVLTPLGTQSKIYEIQSDYCFVKKQENRNRLYKFHVSELIKK